MHARPRRRHSAHAAARCRPDEAHALAPGCAGEMSTLCRRMSPQVLRPRTMCVPSGASAVKHSAVRRAALRQAARSRRASLRGFLRAARAARRQNIRKQVPARAALRRQRRGGVGATLRVARCHGHLVRHSWANGEGAARAVRQACGGRCGPGSDAMFGARVRVWTAVFLCGKSTAAQGGRAAVLGRLVASPGFFPGEPAPEQAAYELAGPARPCGAFREPSRPMSDSKPRRGEARRHTQDFSESSEAECSAQRGASTGAQRSNSLRHSARRFRPAVREEGRLVRMRDAQTYEHKQRAMTPAVRRVAKRPAAGGSRDGAVCGKPDSGTCESVSAPGPFGSLAVKPRGDPRVGHGESVHTRITGAAAGDRSRACRARRSIGRSQECSSCSTPNQSTLAREGWARVSQGARF